MATLPDYLTAEIWMEQAFQSREALKGGVVKRQISDVERLVGRKTFLLAAARRGFQVVQNGRHFVIFCNAQPIVRVDTRAFESPCTRFENRVGRRFETPCACSSSGCILGGGKCEEGGDDVERSIQQLHERARRKGPFRRIWRAFRFRNPDAADP